MRSQTISFAVLTIIFGLTRALPPGDVVEYEASPFVTVIETSNENFVSGKYCNVTLFSKPNFIGNAYIVQAPALKCVEMNLRWAPFVPNNVKSIRIDTVECVCYLGIANRACKDFFPPFGFEAPGLREINKLALSWICQAPPK